MASFAITTIGAIWDEAALPDAVGLARRFELAWKQSKAGQSPDPLDFLDSTDLAHDASLLALLRVDLAQRFRIGQHPRIESYRDRHACLRGDALVALVYEEFCLREDLGELPEPEPYLTRFPEVADRLREVFEIHELVADPGSTALDDEVHAIPFPEVGQTIAGFQLVEELGRGSFARVFLAHERQLGDRPVALKVSRTGSREPQTLAKLQHTHIVPIHSYRVDPATGLHLLCMPFFGRVTLARLLADPALKMPGFDVDLDAILGRLGATSPPSSCRAILARLPYPRSVAWWGARLAEGLQHAHDRGVLHRDVKPSNVLIAEDGMPMLLDFNLAREADLETVTPARLGGTLAYMAPEHLGALVDGSDQAIDPRADLYSLGVVLLEALGVTPLAGPAEATTLVDSLTWLLENRRREAPRLVDCPRVIPPALRAVIRRCLAPDPADRYASAGELAQDLQAVADDRPLQFASEPFSIRARRWFRRYRRKLALAGPLLVALLALVTMEIRTRADRDRQESSARELAEDGRRSALRGEFRAAADQFGRALALIRDRQDLGSMQLELGQKIQEAETAERVRDQTDTFFREAELLRFAFLGFEGDRTAASIQMAASLRPFDVGGSANWIERRELKDLDEPRRRRLVREVDDLFFFSVIALALETRDKVKVSQNALDYCDRALQFTEHPAPWCVLRDWWADRSISRPSLPTDLAAEPSAVACFRWYLLGKLALVPKLSMAWLERAERLEPENHWTQFALGFELDRQGRPDLAMVHAHAAVALRPRSPWPWKVRARIARSLGRWSSALADLDQALALCRSTEERTRVRLDRGRTRHQLGDLIGAGHDYYFASLMAADGDPLARDARRNLARLEADQGFERQALFRYDELVASDPRDHRSRRGRARLLLRRGRLDAAEADLTILIESNPADLASAHAERAVARLASDRPIEAEADAVVAFRLDPAESTARLIGRARLAANLDLEDWPDDPSAFDDWPDGGRKLRDDLRAAAARFESRVSDPGALGFEARFTRAVLLSAAGEQTRAIAEADVLLKLDPRSIRVRRLRGSILERAGKLDEALTEVTQSLAIEADDPTARELRGRIRLRTGDFERALDDLRIDGPSRAEALMALGRHQEAAGVWSKVVANDPLDVRGWLGLAKARRLLGDWDLALVAVEQAAATVDDRSPWLGRVALSYAATLPARPGCWPRLIDLGRRMGVGMARAQ